MAETRAKLIAQGMDVTTTLNDLEEIALKSHERIIRNGLNTFLEVGHALAEIRDRRLYRETHNSFEKYCKETWDLSKGYAIQQIKGYETINLLETRMVAIATENDPDETVMDVINAESKATVKPTIVLPMNEAQTRPLTKLKDPDDQVRAWGIVLEILNQNPKARLTASLINKAVKEVKGEAIKQTVEETKKAVDKTVRVTNIFKKQYQILLEIVVSAQNENWKTMKKTEVIKHLEALIRIVKEEG